MSLNSVSLMGRLTSDIELKSTPSGKSVANFTLAINKFSTKDHPESSFIDCVAWSGTAELIAKYFKKGYKLVVSGRLETRTYEDKNNAKRKVTEVIVSEIDFPDNKGGSTSTTTESLPDTVEEDDGIIATPDDEDPF